MNFIRISLCLSIFCIFNPNDALAIVNCKSDFNASLNFVIQADRQYISSNKHDKSHESFLIEQDYDNANLELDQAITYAQEAIASYQSAQIFLEQIIEYRCWRKVKKATKKLNYVNWKLSRLEDSLEVLRLIKSYM